MGFTYESRFKKKFKLEKNWMMNVLDISEITGLDPEELQGVYLKALNETKSRSQARSRRTTGQTFRCLEPNRRGYPGR